MNLDASTRMAKWFVWSCDHLPLTVGQYIVKDNDGDRVSRARTAAYYITNGTTLCHLFWAMLWVPLAIAAAFGFVLSMVVFAHVAMHDSFVLDHPYVSPALQVAAYFLPEAWLIVFAFAFGLIILTCIGGAKSGFFSLLWQYLKGIKSRVCPLVQFNSLRAAE